MRAVIFAASLCVALSLSLGARAQTDPADLAFWQSIMTSTDPEEYKAYLDAFPNGRFAALARLRLRPGALQPKRPPKPQQQLPALQQAPAQPAQPPAIAAPPPAPAAPPPPAPAAAEPPPPPAVEHPEHIGITPPNAKVGQQVTLTCDKFPQPTNYDLLLVVPAGTPDYNPLRTDAENHVLWKNYASNCSLYTQKAGPFAPGNYEARFVTKLYNNDGRLEMVAKTSFSVQ
jgi:hypothetical protein